MTGHLSRAFEDLISEEPPLRLTVTDVVKRGQKRQQTRRRWLLAALVAVLLPVPAAGLGFASAMTNRPTHLPQPDVSSGVAAPTKSAAPQATHTTAPRGSAQPPSSPAAANPVNQLDDPSFEVVPTAWTKFKPATTVLTSTNIARTGAHAVEITTTSTTNAVGGVISNPSRLVTTAGTTYNASCWVRAPVKVDATLQVQEYTKMPDKSLQRAGDPAKSDQAWLIDPQRWYQISVTYTAQQTGKILPLVVFSSWLRAGYSSLVIDDCSMTIMGS
jgi:hypothetical protein